jgi:hypothetical protein
VVYQSKSNKKTKSLIDKYVGGARTVCHKAAYIIRDGESNGDKLESSVNFAFSMMIYHNQKQAVQVIHEICEINKVSYNTKQISYKVKSTTKENNN